MSGKNNENYLFKFWKILQSVIKEWNNLTTPTMETTIKKTIAIISICFIAGLFFLIAGEIVVKLLRIIL